MNGLALLEVAQDAIRETFGQVVTFRGQSLSASINWMPSANWKRGADGSNKPQFITPGYTEIHVFRSAISDTPKVGETFTDSLARVHRIQKVQEIHNYWSCLCLVSTTV
jgi:hypothetical protein